MININQFEKIFLFNGKVDFRWAIDGLAALIQEEMNLSPYQSALFIFIGRRKNKIKILYWDKTGFALWYKRLEKDRFPVPRNVPDKNITITEEQFLWFLQGYDLWKMHPHQELHFEECS